MEDHLPRKLAAILYADVAGYSRLTGEDEEGTHRRLSEYLDIISSTIEQHQGRVIHYAGDAVLADFGTVTKAVTCATTIQREITSRNQELRDERKVQFRIGVNLGEVIVDRDDIYGEGVNVAARLEALAEPGGICISESVRSAIGNKLDLDYDDIGEPRLKNIARPVRAYQVRLRAEGRPTPGPKRAKQKFGTWLEVGLLLAMVAALTAAGLAYLRPWEPEVISGAIERDVPPLSKKPSIAVLPFSNLSDDPSQEYFADGITEDLTTDLSKISALFVIARNSAFTYKGKAVKPQQVAKELGVRYVLEGSARRVGNQVRINAQLIDAATGGHLWAERYDGSIDNIFALQDQVTAKIVAALAVTMTSNEKLAQARRETENPDAYDAFLQGWTLFKRHTTRDFVAAVPYLEKAIALDPAYGRAYAALAAIHWAAFRIGFHDELEISTAFGALDRAEQWLAKALQYPTPLAHMVASRLLSWKHNHDAAITEAERAINLDPNDPSGHVALAESLVWAGRSADAFDPISTAMRLDPQDTDFYTGILGFAQFEVEQFAAAVVSLERATQRSPGIHHFWILLCASYAAVGRERDARLALEKANELMLDAGWPRFRIDIINDWWPFKEQADLDRLSNALRSLGIRDS